MTEVVAALTWQGNKFMIGQHPAHLTLFNATITKSNPQKLEHNHIKRITPNKILKYEFCPAEKEIFSKICKVHK